MYLKTGVLLIIMIGGYKLLGYKCQWCNSLKKSVNGVIKLFA